MENFVCFKALNGSFQWASTIPYCILHLLNEAQRGESCTWDISCLCLSICAFLGDFCVRMNTCLLCCLFWTLSMVKFDNVQGDRMPNAKHLLAKLLGNTHRSVGLHKQLSHNYWEGVSMSPEKSVFKDKVFAMSWNSIPLFLMVIIEVGLKCNVTLDYPFHSFPKAALDAEVEVFPLLTTFCSPGLISSMSFLS